MKKLLIVFTSIMILLVPLSSATILQTNLSWIEKKLSVPTDAEYDGSFIGGLGQIYKEHDEWDYEIHSYIAGVYKENNNKKLFGNIYNLDQEKTGSILLISSRIFLVGVIQDVDGHRVPIVGFIFDRDDETFIGRIMSIYGPAPYMYGKYIPN